MGSGAGARAAQPVRPGRTFDPTVVRQTFKVYQTHALCHYVETLAKLSSQLSSRKAKRSSDVPGSRRTRLCKTSCKDDEGKTQAHVNDVDGAASALQAMTVVEQPSSADSACNATPEPRRQHSRDWGQGNTQNKADQSEVRNFNQGLETARQLF